MTSSRARALGPPLRQAPAPHLSQVQEGPEGSEGWEGGEGAEQAEGAEGALQLAQYVCM